MSITYEQLKDAAAGTMDEKELMVVHNGRITAMRGYNERPSKETKSDWDAAREAYQDLFDRLVAAYFPSEAKGPEGERFKTRAQAYKWLQAQGYKVSQGKFFADCLNGFPLVHQDKSVSRYQVLQYAQQLGVERISGSGDDQRQADEDRKTKADADKAELQTEILRREQDREWLHADQAWAIIAALLGSLRDAIRHHVNRKQGELAHVAGGRQEMAGDLDAAVDAVIDEAFNEVCGVDRFDGMFAEDD